MTSLKIETFVPDWTISDIARPLWERVGTRFFQVSDQGHGIVKLTCQVCLEGTPDFLAYTGRYGKRTRLAQSA